MRQLEIEVPSPFRLDLTVWVLRRRPHNLVDRWDGTWYRRTLVLGLRPVEVSVRQASVSSVLTVELRGSSVALGDDTVVEVRRVLEHTLGLGVDLGGFYRMAERDERLRELAGQFRGVRPPCFPSVFEAVVNAIACQQLSLVVGIHLLNRLTKRYGPTRSEGSPPGFPTPGRLAETDTEDLRELGLQPGEGPSGDRARPTGGERGGRPRGAARRARRSCAGDAARSRWCRALERRVHAPAWAWTPSRAAR